MAIDVEALKGRTDIVAVVGSYVELKKRGSEYVGRCVAHDDHSPSMWVSPQKGLIHCFACGFSQDVIGFVQHMEHADFGKACEILGAKDDWTPAKPIAQEPQRPRRETSKPPAEAGKPDMDLRGLGKPVAVWTYKDADGEPLMYVARYEVDGKKEIRCWTWGRRGDDEAGWACGHWTGPRPLYRLDALKSRPDAPVLIVEGEKAADAAQQLLPGYVVTTWPAGAQSWKRADLEPLRARRVDLWPDADEPGREAMGALRGVISDPRGLGCNGKLIETSDLPEGFDAADWQGDDILAWLRSRAKPYAPTAAPVEEPPEPEFPPEAVAEKPKKSKRPRLSVVGNTALSADPDEEPLPASMSEDALADHFATQHAPSWRYVKAWSAWFEWRSDGWYRDDTALIDRLAVQLTRQALYWPEAASLTTPDSRRRLNSKRTAGNLRDIAGTDRRIAATVDQWDQHPMLLGVPGGVVDLETGKLLEPDPMLYITKRTSVAPEDGDCPQWLALLRRATQGDESLLAYLQRLCGYVLTGETREEVFGFVYGPGQTGKSTAIRVLSEIMGDYHRKASMDTFMESKHERHAEELAVLVGARLVTGVETEEGKRWNESRIKALTGRDRIRARFMRENSFEFDPQFKIIVAGNHAPHLRNVDDAIRRRLHIIPFTQPIPMEERDDKLAEKLRAEYPQILAWMIRGCLDWQAYGLGRPEQIARAVDTYLEAEDILGTWIEECTTRGNGAKCQTTGAYRAFKSWAEQQGEYAPSQKRFVQALKERGFDASRYAGKRYIFGISIATDDEPPAIPYS